MDDIVTENAYNHALKEQTEQSLKFRNVGIGIMAIHDLLIKFGLVYGSQESLDLIKKIMNFIFVESLKVSAKLGKELGSFPGYNEKVWDATIIQNNLSKEDIKFLREQNTLRNCSLLSIAPTGSIGTMFNVSTGCEPWFALHYTRHTKSLDGETDRSFEVWAPIAEEAAKRTWHPECLITSNDISWKDHINMQSILQESCDTAISKTINMSKNTTIDDIKKLYLYCWEKGLKGCTIFVEGSREAILTTDNTNIPIESSILQRGFVVKANDNCIGLKRTLTTGCGSLHCTAFFDPKTGDLRETYLNKGSQGGCNNFMIGLSRMISLASRGGISLEKVLDQLKSCGTCPSYAVRTSTKHDTSQGSCCPIAVGNALKDMHTEVLQRLADCNCQTDIQSNINENKQEEYEECPECHQKTLIHESGCVSCTSCGFTRCG